jgi:hypothetical protein
MVKLGQIITTLSPRLRYGRMADSFSYFISPFGCNYNGEDTSIQDRGRDNDIMGHLVYDNCDVVFSGGLGNLIPCIIITDQLNTQPIVRLGLRYCKMLIFQVVF